VNANTSMKPRVLSGMRSTGKLHLGNYVGALENWVKLQDSGDYDCFFFIADWHALTTDYADTSNVEQNTWEVLVDWLAAGIDPEKSVVFLQSHVPQHAELHLIFSMITPLGWLERVPTYKEQRDNIKDKDLGTYGFLGYPLLQAADILMYGRPGAKDPAKDNPLFVPVGEDQVAHIELTREVARRFNQFYTLSSRYAYEVRNPSTVQSGRVITPPRQTPIVGAGVSEVASEHSYVFPEPQALLTPSPKLPGTDGRKMSKSYGNTIMLSEPPESIRQKLKTMVTDPARVRRTDPGDPDKCPVGDLHKIFSTKETLTKVYEGCRSAGIGCIECKGWAAESLIRKIEPMQERRKKYEENPQRAWDILEAGSRKAQAMAQATYDAARDAMHMSYKHQPPVKSSS
jgi:tryptophanyl-tRNA synthetase